MGIKIGRKRRKFKEGKVKEWCIKPWISEYYNQLSLDSEGIVIFSEKYVVVDGIISKLIKGGVQWNPFVVRVKNLLHANGKRGRMGVYDIKVSDNEDEVRIYLGTGESIKKVAKKIKPGMLIRVLSYHVTRINKKKIIYVVRFQIPINVEASGIV